MSTEDLESQTDFKPGGPDVVSLVACDTCAANDRFKPIGRTRHWSRGEICLGTLTKIYYVRATQPASSEREGQR